MRDRAERRRTGWHRTRVVAGILVLIAALVNLARILLGQVPADDPITLTVGLSLLLIDALLLAFAFRARRARYQAEQRPLHFPHEESS
jgi:uncharacterized membrane protein